MFRQILRPALLLLSVAIILSGCGGSNSPVTVAPPVTTTAPLASGGAATIYTVQNNGNQNGTVQSFSLSVSGTMTPAGTLVIPSPTQATSVAIDPVNGTMYVAAYNPNIGSEIFAYAAGSTGAATPMRTMILASPQTIIYCSAYAMTVDTSGVLYAAYQNCLGNAAATTSGVLVFSATANGAVTPIRSYYGSASQLSSTGLPLGIAVDNAGTLYVSTATTGATYTGSILEFAAGTTSNTAPTRTITSSNSFYYGLAVDSSRNLYAVQEASGSAVTNYNPTIVEYAAGASGASPTPLKSIAGSSVITYLGQLQSDAVGNLYAINQSTTGTFSLVGFGPTATGAIAPALNIFSASLTSATTSSIAVH